MGSGTGSPLQPPGRRKTDDGGQTTEDGSSPAVVCFREASWLTDDGGQTTDDGMQSALRHPISVVRMGIGNENDQDNRAISTGKLNALLRLHTRPINVVVYHGSQGRTRFEVGFPLRCFQRLSRPYIATLHCGWRHNSSTRGTSIPVLSY